MATITVSEWVNFNHPMMQAHGELLGSHALIGEPVLNGIRIQHGQLGPNVGHRCCESILQLS
jgi:hypothetical protein